MLDYYGSIIKNEEEIDKELIQSFKDRCYESYMKKIISDLRKEEVLTNILNLGGGYFIRKLNKIITIQINYDLQKSEKRIKFLYCFNQLYDDIDICKIICDKI